MPPVRGRELKPESFAPDEASDEDAPCAGARIETQEEYERVIAERMPPVRGRELKLQTAQSKQ